MANYILLDHGDGTISRYLHLMRDGVDVSVGEVVERGRIAGRETPDSQPSTLAFSGH